MTIMKKKKIKFNLNWYEKDTEKLDFKIELKKMQREKKVNKKKTWNSDALYKRMRTNRLFGDNVQHI